MCGCTQPRYYRSKTTSKKASQLSDTEKRSMVQSHEDGSTIYELAIVYGVTPRSVAAFVANAHR